MPFADLHVHTDASDGTLSVEEVPAAARRADLEAVAITDHDRSNPAVDAPVTRVDGVLLIHGLELRVESPAGRIDLLGYGLEPTAALEAEVQRLQTDRIERGRQIIENIEARLDVDLDLEAREGIGRPTIARAVVAHPDCPQETVGAVFDELIADDGPCYVPRDVPSFDRGRELLAEACDLVGLAHPLRYDDLETALDLAASLDAIERWYPYADPIDPAPIETAIERHDLIPTGGSDSHTEELGSMGTSEPAFRAVADRLPDPI